jgi:hypothetical protein
VVANHAYWVSGLKARKPGSLGTFDAVSQAFGLADPKPSGTKNGSGTLKGGNLGPIHFTSQTQTWGSSGHVQRRDRIVVTARNIAQAALDVFRAHANCQVKLVIHSNGPIAVRLPGCQRVVHAS